MTQLENDVQAGLIIRRRLGKPSAQWPPGWARRNAAMDLVALPVSVLAIKLLRCISPLLLLLTASTILGASDEPVMRTRGLCQFMLHEYVLPQRSETVLNEIVAKTVKQHQTVFGFELRPRFRVRIRIFGEYAEYERFTRTNQYAREIAKITTSLTNLNGYYSHGSREIVTWRQQQPSYLANNILHEVSHAIMFGHYRRIPIWLSEGCATYFAFPPNMQDEHDIGSLKYRWAILNIWLREKKLPELKSFLDLSDEEWRKLDPNQAYTVSWSIFQILMSTPQNQRVLRQLMLDLQIPPGSKMDCAERLEAAYPGGLKQLEQNWHYWIARVGAKILGPEMESILKRVKSK